MERSEGTVDWGGRVRSLITYALCWYRGFLAMIDVRRLIKI